MFDRSMLYNGSDVIRDVEWVIFDEVHYINDTEVILFSLYACSVAYTLIMSVCDDTPCVHVHCT